MITFFTTCKDFARAEHNAINSWLALNKLTEVLVFTEGKQLVSCIDPKRITYKHISGKHPTGLPLLNALFEEASKGSKFDILCYCNSDIILLPDFLERIKPVLKLNYPFLAVSQRIDVHIGTDMDLTNEECVVQLKQVMVSEGKIHPPLGSDVFVFPKFQYSQQTMPPLVVGRPGWDNWMLYDARKRFNKLINFTGDYPAIVHQDHLNRYDSKNVKDQINMKYLPKSDQYTFVLSYCNYNVRNGKIKKVKTYEKDLTRIRWEIRFNKSNNVFRNFYLFILLSNLVIQSTIKKAVKKINALSHLTKPVS